MKTLLLEPKSILMQSRTQQKQSSSSSSFSSWEPSFLHAGSTHILWSAEWASFHGSQRRPSHSLNRRPTHSRIESPIQSHHHLHVQLNAQQTLAPLTSHRHPTSHFPPPLRPPLLPSPTQLAQTTFDGFTKTFVLGQPLALRERC